MYQRWSGLGVQDPGEWLCGMVRQKSQHPECEQDKGTLNIWKISIKAEEYIGDLEQHMLSSTSLSDKALFISAR